MKIASKRYVCLVVFMSICFQARALSAHTAETEKINFLVGTQSLRRVNQVREYCTVYRIDRLQ